MKSYSAYMTEDELFHAYWKVTAEDPYGQAIEFSYYEDVQRTHGEARVLSNSEVSNLRQKKIRVDRYLSIVHGRDIFRDFMYSMDMLGVYNYREHDAFITGWYQAIEFAIRRDEG